MSSGWGVRSVIFAGVLPQADTRVFSEDITLTETDISNAYIVLSKQPIEPGETELEVGGLNHLYGTDYTVINVLGEWRLIWGEMGLMSILSAGDVCQVSYPAEFAAP